MGERRHREHMTVARLLGRGGGKRRGNGRPEIPKSPTFVRFFEQSDEQRKAAAQTRSRAKQLLDESPKRPAIDNYRQLVDKQMLSNIPEYTEEDTEEGTKDRRIELLEAKSDRELADEKLKHVASQEFDDRQGRKTPGDRQLGRKNRSIEIREENRHARRHKTV